MKTLKTLLAATAFTHAPVCLAEAQDLFHENEEIDFSFGDNCEKLEDLTYEALQLLVIAVEDRAQDRFCSYAHPADCSDYGWIVEGFGHLDASRNDGYCRFVPELERRRNVPDKREWYGLVADPAQSAG